jgi:two-component system OmpR family sensor kinase
LLVLMFRNLIENAVKFTGEGARIEVRASENGHTALVEVADTGPGVPEEEQSLIFENLYRGKNAHGTHGSGMGLPLVQRIVALHEGSISIRSRPNSGTIFTIALRLAEVS